MTPDHADSSQPAVRPEMQPTLQAVDELTRFQGPPEQFLVRLLAMQCRVAGALGGAILRAGPEKQIDVLAVHPPLAEGVTAPVWLAQAVELAPEAVSAGETTVRPLHAPDDLYGHPAKRHLIQVPLRSPGFSGLAAFVVETHSAAAVDSSRQRVELTSGLLALYEMRVALQRRGADLERLRNAVELLPPVNENDRFAAAAMAFCNELAARWQCERVHLGFLEGRYVELRAMSHTEKFSRKMRLVQDIEAAMEECLDQDTEVTYPGEQDATVLTRAAAELTERHGPTAALSLPLRKGGKPVAVLTLERSRDRPFGLNEIEALRLACELSTPRLVDLYERDRWVGAKAAGWLREVGAAIVGPKHTWKKLAAALVFLGIIFLLVAQGRYTADASFALEATQRQVVSAPFDGYLKEVFVSPNDDVVAGETVLATFQTADLKLRLARARAERSAHLKEAAAAMRDDRRAETQIARAQAERAAAQVRELEYQIDKARITSPLSGKVVTGDLRRHVGRRFTPGEVLFEVAPVRALRAELAVPEDEIADVRMGQKGELATASKPDVRFAFEVERIHPVAEVVGQRNVFRVQARLLETADWMRPGMEGLAKVHIGRRRYAWLWTRRLVNWLRMKLWL